MARQQFRNMHVVGLAKMQPNDNVVPLPGRARVSEDRPDAIEQCRGDPVALLRIAARMLDATADLWTGPRLEAAGMIEQALRAQWRVLDCIRGSGAPFPDGSNV